MSRVTLSRASAVDLGAQRLLLGVGGAREEEVLPHQDSPLVA